MSTPDVDAYGQRIPEQPRRESANLHRRSLVWQPFYRIPPADDVHQRHTGDLSYAFAEVAIAGGDDEAFVGCYALDEAVIGVGAGVGAAEALEAGIASNAVGGWGEYGVRWGNEKEDEEGKCTNRSATRYLWPSFSSSAITQSVTQGIPVDLWL